MWRASNVFRRAPLARAFRASPIARAEIPIADLHKIGEAALKAKGFGKADTAVLLDVMLWTQLRKGPGLAALTTGALAPPVMAAVRPLEYETKLSARIDGQQRAGMLVMHQAVDVAVGKAQQNGVGLVGTRNVGSSPGALGYYLEHIANNGLIGLVFAQTPPAAGAATAAASPLGVSVPSAAGAVVLDAATATASVLGGEPSAGLSDTLAILDRSYKGSHLSVMVELLAGPLVGGGASADAYGNLVLAFDPGLLGDREKFQRDVEAVLRRVQGERSAAPPTPAPFVNLSAATAAVPGAAATWQAERALRQGQVHVDDTLLRELQAAAVAPPSAAFAPAAAATGGKSGLAMATKLAHPAGKGKGDPFNASSPVLYQTATFELDSKELSGEYDYTRSGNPTRHMLEEQMADLEGATKAFAFTSGMAALAIALRLVPAGGHIVTGDDIYGGTSRLLSRCAPDAGVEVSNVDMCDLDAVQNAMRPNTKLVWMESPTNPRMQITDIASIASLARSRGALSLVDNSIMAPVFQAPLALGVDICMTSATKFIGGHSDVTAGILSVNGEETAQRVGFLQNSEGAGLAPFDCWLLLRGLKTMSLRMERQQENAMAMAQWLQAHPAVSQINYPGLPTDKGYALHMSQASGGGTLLSFETGNVDLSKGLSEYTKLFKVTVSFGSTTSLLSLPCFMSHASIPPEVRRARGLPDDLVRISAGIEDANDLIADLEQAFDKSLAAAGVGAANLDATSSWYPKTYVGPR